MNQREPFKGPNSGPALLLGPHRYHPRDLRGSGRHRDAHWASESRRGVLTDGQQLLVGVDTVTTLRSYRQRTIKTLSLDTCHR